MPWQKLGSWARVALVLSAICLAGYPAHWIMRERETLDGKRDTILKACARIQDIDANGACSGRARMDRARDGAGVDAGYAVGLALAIAAATWAIAPAIGAIVRKVRRDQET